MITFTLTNGMQIDLDLNPNNTYSIIKRVGMFDRVIVTGLTLDQINPTLLVILDHEVPEPNKSFYISQD